MIPFSKFETTAWKHEIQKGTTKHWLKTMVEGRYVKATSHFHITAKMKCLRWAVTSSVPTAPLHVEVLRLFRRPTHTPSRSWACAVCQLHNKVSRHYGKGTKWQATDDGVHALPPVGKGPAHYGDVCQTRGMEQHVQVTCQLHALCPGTVTPRMPATRQSVQALREQKNINLKWNHDESE